MTQDTQWRAELVQDVYDLYIQFLKATGQWAEALKVTIEKRETLRELQNSNDTV
jgi:hypothetical protein